MSFDPTGQPGPVQLHVGVVVDVQATVRQYLVRIDSYNLPQLACKDISDIGTGPHGPRKIGMYPPGTPVLVSVQLGPIGDQPSGTGQLVPKAPGYIMGAVPSETASNRRRVCDSVIPLSTANAVNDEAHTYVHQVFPKSLQDWNEGVPIDVVPGSDEGIINDLGTGYGTSRFFSWMRASESAGIWFFYFDNLTRLAAYNYEFWNAGGERWIKNDEGEVSDVDLFTPYPWEAMGKPSRDAAATAEKAAGGIYKAGATDMYNEPEDDKQMVIARMIKMRGYLGDMQRNMVVIPPKSPENPEVYGTPSDYNGLLNEQWHTNGAYTLQSARSITLEKYVNIPAPKQIEPPEQDDSIGDGASNYRAAGEWGNTAIARDATDLGFEGHAKWSNYMAAVPAYGIGGCYADYHAYLLNWYGCRTLIAHQNDWYLPEESTQFQGVTMGAYNTSTGTTDSLFLVAQPNFTEISIDHRTGLTRYYASRSAIAMLPDGSILLEDGYGSQIIMSGGSITLTSPGDVFLRPGRSLISWAGSDTILRTGGSMDLSTTEGDIRIGAKHNLHMIGGMDKTKPGGILMECRSKWSSGVNDFTGVGEDIKFYGITMLSKESPVSAYGSDIYLRAYSETPANSCGNVMIEADNWQMHSAAKEFFRFCAYGFTEIMNFAIGNETILTTTKDKVTWARWEDKYTYFGIGTAYKDSSMFRTDHAVNSFTGSKGVISATYVDQLNYAADSGSPNPGPRSHVTGIEAYTIDCPGAPSASKNTSWCDYYDNKLITKMKKMRNYDYANPADSDIFGKTSYMKELGFTWRNTAQYNVSDFYLTETRWQQVGRLHGSGYILWNEYMLKTNNAAVAYPDDYTTPHPGRETWFVDSKFYEITPQLVDGNDVSKARSGGAYNTWASVNHAAGSEGPGGAPGPGVNQRIFNGFYKIARLL